MKRLFFRPGVLLLTLIVSVFAIAPHGHSLLEDITREGSFVERIGTCDGSTVAHLHSARLVHQHACVACARQHSVSALRVVAIHAAARSSLTKLSLVAIAPGRPALPTAQLRAPPV